MFKLSQKITDHIYVDNNQWSVRNHLNMQHWGNYVSDTSIKEGFLHRSSVITLSKKIYAKIQFNLVSEIW